MARTSTARRAGRGRSCRARDRADQRGRRAARRARADGDARPRSGRRPRSTPARSSASRDDARRRAARRRPRVGRSRRRRPSTIAGSRSRSPSAGVALPGARVVASLAELDAHLATASRPRPRGSCKAPWTAAGRDRCVGAGARRPTSRANADRAPARAASARSCSSRGSIASSTSACARAIDRRRRRRPSHPPHRLTHRRRAAGSRGIELAAASLEPAERDQLADGRGAPAPRSHRAGYAGPFAIDAFAYCATTAARRRFHPLCELNARHTFGHVAHAVARQVLRQPLERIGQLGAPDRLAAVARHDRDRRRRRLDLDDDRHVDHARQLALAALRDRPPSCACTWSSAEPARRPPLQRARAPR